MDPGIAHNGWRLNTPPDRHDHRGTSEPARGHGHHGGDPSVAATELGLAVAVPAKETPDAPAPADGSGESALTRRLKSLLPWSTDTDPVSTLIRTHRSIHSDADPGIVRHAYETAERMHRGQMRKSGEPFITHPVAVAAILSDLGMDTVTLVAAMLHDTVEDTSYTIAALESDFGPEVALIVDGLTKFDKLFFGEAAEAETLRKLIIAAGRDVRVLVIKLADRLHNMRTLDARSTKSQQRIATATRDVLVPLCDRLGIQVIKRDLEDCILKALSPSGYALITEYLTQREGWDEYLERARSAFTTELKNGRVDCKITVRPRHLYSIWKDTVAGRHSEPHDLPRLVVQVEGDDMDCYAALGIIHGRWRPVPGRFKDFIASPKNNLYRSLHTTVIGPDGRSVEVLIRTHEMHLSAEYGVAVNFRYPQGRAGFGPAARAEQLDWLQRVLDWESAAAEPGQFLASLRCDLSEGQIIVFTSTGRPVLLPSDSTPIDLAYTLSADTGNRCIGSRINGRLVPLSSILADGDSVEIITRDNGADEGGPSEEWLDFVKTPHARLHIGRWFEKRSETVTIANKVRLGRVAVGLALRQHGRGLASDLPLVRLATQLGFPDLETLLVAVADHKVSANTVVDRLIRAVDHSPH
ncbi:GTP pyrophosphokinase [Virgisporangium aurantiacum]|uniref:GTP pyrophosphokinase n=1 Tax=Virgisporangium aurantiacum TaxID=175570 RepID=A0A8J4E424_9ACTN|nr:GTP pyrophosphokinase [Virgisporangium aurantiacum]